MHKETYCLNNPAIGTYVNESNINYCLHGIESRAEDCAYISIEGTTQTSYHKFKIRYTKERSYIFLTTRRLHYWNTLFFSHTHLKTTM